jgi:hypothetical protein
MNNRRLRPLTLDQSGAKLTTSSLSEQRSNAAASQLYVTLCGRAASWFQSPAADKSFKPKPLFGSG